MRRKALTVTQRRGAQSAMAASRAAFRKCQRELPVGTVRRGGFAAQAADLVSAIDSLGIARDDPLVAVVVRQSLGNIADAARDAANAAA